MNDCDNKKTRKHLTRNEKDLFELIKNKRNSNGIFDERMIPELRMFFKRRLSSRLFNINCYDENGFTPLMIVCNDIDEELLVSEDYENHAKEVIMILLENGANINIQITENEDYFGRTALHITCSFSTSNMVRFLLCHGADPQIRDNHGLTSLFISLWYSKYDVVKVLLEYGVEDLNCNTFCGNAPIHTILRWIRYTNHVSRGITLLREYGADVNFQNKDGATPLLLAITNCQQWLAPELSIIKLLLDANADVNIQVSTANHHYGIFVYIEGDTALHIAVRSSGCIKLVQLLLEYYTNLGITNTEHETILDIAIKNKSYEIIDIIKEKLRHQMYKYLVCQWTPLKTPTIPNQIIKSTSTPFVMKRKLDHL